MGVYQKVSASIFAATMGHSRDRLLSAMGFAWNAKARGRRWSSARCTAGLDPRALVAMAAALAIVAGLPAIDRARL